MEMSPIKKIVIALVVVTVALSVITANNMASVMLIVASREAGSAAQQNVQTNTVVQNQTNNNSQGSMSNNNSSDNTVSDNTGVTQNDATNNVVQNQTNNDASNNTSNNDSASQNVETTAPAADNKGDASANTDADKDAADKDAADNKNDADSGASAKLSDEEVVDLYKKAMNNARTKSTSVVRVKDGAINYKGIVEAGKLSSIASSLMGMFMKSDASAIEAKNEAWEKEKLPDASALTVNGLQKISYEDKGDTYVVTLVAKNATNPKAGADGVGAISGVIEESQITGAIGSVPGLALEGISIDYENVTSVATIDKATGNLVALNLDAPCVLNIAYAKVPLLGEVNNAKVGIQVITEYTVAY